MAALPARRPPRGGRRAMLVASPAACCGGARHMAPGRERRDAAALGLYAETPADGAAMCTVAGAPAHPGGAGAGRCWSHRPRCVAAGARNSGAQPSPLPLEPMARPWRPGAARRCRSCDLCRNPAGPCRDVQRCRGARPSGGAGAGRCWSHRPRRGATGVGGERGGFGPPGRRSANRARRHHAGPDRTCGQHRAPGQVGGNHGRVPVAHHRPGGQLVGAIGDQAEERPLSAAVPGPARSPGSPANQTMPNR